MIGKNEEKNKTSFVYNWKFLMEYKGIFVLLFGIWLSLQSQYFYVINYRKAAAAAVAAVGELRTKRKQCVLKSKQMDSKHFFMTHK